MPPTTTIVGSVTGGMSAVGSSDGQLGCPPTLGRAVVAQGCSLGQETAGVDRHFECVQAGSPGPPVRVGEQLQLCRRAVVGPAPGGGTAPTPRGVGGVVAAVLR